MAEQSASPHILLKKSRLIDRWLTGNCDHSNVHEQAQQAAAAYCEPISLDRQPEWGEHCSALGLSACAEQRLLQPKAIG